MNGMHGRGRSIAVLAALTAGLVLGTGGPAQAAPGDVTASQVADIYPGSGPGHSSDPRSLFNAGGTLLFQASDPTNGDELWKSNGGPLGPGGTEMVANINPGSQGSNVTEFTSIGSTVFFEASDGYGVGATEHGNELWKIDPPYTTPVMVDDIRPGAGVGSDPELLTNANGTLLFRANDGTDGEELWKSEAPYTSATQVADINLGPSSSDIDELTVVNGILFFVATDGTHGDELWKSNPPFTSASMVEDIDPGTTQVPAHLTDVNGTLLFAANDGANGEEPWRSSGPAYDSASTDMVQDINTTATEGSFPAVFTNVDGTLFFRAEEASGDTEVWKSGSPFTSATKLNVNSTSSNSSSDPFALAGIGGLLYFTAADGTHGFEPWRSDGGPVGAGTDMISDINPLGGHSNPAGYTGAGGQVFFRADDGTNGVELWRINGSTASMVRNINVTPDPIASSNPDELTDVNGTLFFQANDGVTGVELWKATIEPPPPPPVTPPATAPPSAGAKKKCKKKKAKKGALAAKKKCKKKRNQH